MFEEEVFSRQCIGWRFGLLLQDFTRGVGGIVKVLPMGIIATSTFGALICSGVSLWDSGEDTPPGRPAAP
jgi:hypothetical protein